MKLKYISFLMFFALTALGQNPAPGSKQTEPIIIENAEIHVGNGTVINGSILIQNGLITQVGNIPAEPIGTLHIDARGKKVYPGFISPNSQLGLIEVEAVRTTIDANELGNMNPSVRAQIAHNTDSEVIPTVRGNGVLIGQTTPVGGMVSGRSGVMNYDGWNWEDALLKSEDGLWINWPAMRRSSYDRATSTRTLRDNENYFSDVNNLKKLFTDSKAYSALTNPTNVNQNLGAVEALWSGDMRLYINVNNAKEIIAAINFVKEMEVKYPVLVGVEECLAVLDLIKESKIPVLLPTTHRLPNTADEDIWEPYKMPGILMKEGIMIGLYYNESFWRTRNLPFVAGTAAAHGLGKEEAVQLITLNNAKILGIDKMVGSIEVGKQATLFISEGDALDMSTSKVTQAWIQGRTIDLDDKQKRLYNKYLEKYELKK
ncbi:Imidazolonepropionase [Spirosomataceae bacterium TFI 002]|nr:Imidazolonepropionase [Spirosomataceae bacterium TFI 002]